MDGFFRGRCGMSRPEPDGLGTFDHSLCEAAATGKILSVVWQEADEAHADFGSIGMRVRLPNPWLVALVAAVVGGLIGGVTAGVESVWRPWRIGGIDPNASLTGPAPQVRVDETRFNFGSVSVGGSGSHEFTIRNEGAVPLVLTKGATSCTCTVADFEGAGADGSTATVPPGGATTVRVQWKGKGGGGPFRQQATVLTNDPRSGEIAFVIEGTVTPSWKAVPESIVFSRLSTGSPEHVEIDLFTYGPEQPVLERCGVSAAEGDGVAGQSQAAALIAVVSTPLPAEIVAREPGATGGFRVAVDIRSGLPLGSLRESLEVVFRMPEEITAEIPVEGTVTGDLLLAGAGWDSREQALRLGTINAAQNFSTTLFLTAKGPDRERVRPVVREVVPAALQVTVGEPRAVGAGEVLRFPIRVEIPADAPAANHLCSQQAPAGRIVLETGLEGSPTLSIPVCVAITR
jgi:hypothetical protein